MTPQMKLGYEPEPPSIVTRERTTTALLCRSGIPAVTFGANPYVGCEHGCSYCYAKFMTRYAAKPAKWGEFVEPKVNAAAVLKKQIQRTPPGPVALSTVTDPYQPVEAHYGLTRQILKLLLAARFPLSIITKSVLVERDVDILRRFPRRRCEVGMSLAHLDEGRQKRLEPRASAPAARLETLRRMHQKGIRTWAFVAPILPSCTDEEVIDLLRSLQGAVDFILVDKLNPKGTAATNPFGSREQKLQYLARYRALIGKARAMSSRLGYSVMTCGR